MDSARKRAVTSAVLSVAIGVLASAFYKANTGNDLTESSVLSDDFVWNIVQRVEQEHADRPDISTGLQIEKDAQTGIFADGHVTVDELNDTLHAIDPYTTYWTPGQNNEYNSYSNGGANHEDNRITGKILDHNTAYIHLPYVTKSAAKELRQTVENLRLETQSANTSGYILDLRDSPGGNLEQAAKIVDMVMTDGEIFSFREKGKPRWRNARPGNEIGLSPLAILINEQTASAAEILAGALQAHDLATIIGTRSRGKGSIQDIIELEDGNTLLRFIGKPNNSALKVTIAKYTLAFNTHVDGVGITPNIDVATNCVSGGDDPALSCALRFLYEQSKIAKPASPSFTPES